MSNLKNLIIDFSINNTRLIMVLIALMTISFGSFFPMIRIDTDPENMLEPTEDVRVFHNEAKKVFALSETIVVGIINNNNLNGVFNIKTLKNIYDLTEYAKSLRWKDSDKLSGVIEADMVAPSLVDHMSTQGLGTIKFEWLMSKPPKTEREALEVRDRALSNPLLKGKMVSEDGKAISIYLPLTDKLLSYKVYKALNAKIAEIKGEGEEYHIAGLPVAESAIGVEMFNQMTLAAPLTMLVVFMLLRLFFKKWALIILPMIIATVSVVSALGLMIGCGFPVHILSSMLPIFLMPIAICDSVHVLSDFFECYTKEKGIKQSIKEVMQKLFAPLLYTSLTTAAGFLSFTTTSIPPVRVFGIFVAFGVLIAFITTILFVPAYIMMLSEKTLDGFGENNIKKQDQETHLVRFLKFIGGFSYNNAKFVLSILIILTITALWGVSKINVNDNYANRFAMNHPIKQADVALNNHFEGLYTAHLVFEGQKKKKLSLVDIENMKSEFLKFSNTVGAGSSKELKQEVMSSFSVFAEKETDFEVLINKMTSYIEEKSKTAFDDDYYVLQEYKGFFGVELEKQKIFKRPDVLNYIAGLQKYLEDEGIIGKSTSIVDVVKKVNQELIDGKTENYRIPNSLEAIAECFLQFQQSHKPNDLWHMVTPDFMRANVWVQFKTGDSKQTEKAVLAVDNYIKNHKSPVVLTHNWSGLHYINLVFQDKMFWEMLASFIGSFAIVFCMMIFLFRSFSWAAICMLPLSLTILAIYGTTGIVGKDYDMPVAVLSAISLGIAVDFAVHFLERARQSYRKTQSWEKTVFVLFDEPALAISRNVMVVALGFLPLMIAELIPYKATAILLFSILAFSGLMTLTCLPAVLTVAEKHFFKKGEKNV